MTGEVNVTCGECVHAKKKAFNPKSGDLFYMCEMLSTEKEERWCGEFFFCAFGTNEDEDGNFIDGLGSIQTQTTLTTVPRKRGNKK